ncbi:diacylglycerol/lipid kinase family protein [Streptococcus iniae]|nr:diacylglycerol kinase [Streptococcus iniae]
MKKVMLIVNPASGGEKAKAFEKIAKSKLATYFDQVDVRYTEKEGDAKRFAQTAARASYESVFVMGGDGTVNEGVSGLAEESYRPTFGFFPLGTVNDLARALQMPLDPEEAVESLDFTKTQTLDIAKVNDRYFTNILAIGSIPESINNVDDKEKTVLGPLAYFLSGLKNILKNKSYTFTITSDGQEASFTSSLVLLALTNSIGGFDSITPDAKANDGYLHLVFTKDKTAIETMASLPSLFSKTMSSNDAVSYQKVKEVTISVQGCDLESNLDGDPGPKLPLTVTVLPSHLRVYKY